MTIKEMHYDFKKKLNKIDSQQNRNLRVPEVDWTLNEALELFVKMIAQPRASQFLDFEINQRSIDDIRELIIRPDMRFSGPIIGGPLPQTDPASLTISNNMAVLPKDYWMFVKGQVEVVKGDCTALASLLVRRHEEQFEESPFDKSSFEWREVNGLFFKNRIGLHDDGTFENRRVLLTYVKRPVYMHNAEDFGPNGYKLPSGRHLQGSQDCELSEETHREIVDLAVMLASSEMQSTNFQNTLYKLRLNQLQ